MYSTQRVCSDTIRILEIKWSTTHSIKKYIQDLEAFRKAFLHSIYFQVKHFITTELFLITLPLSLKKNYRIIFLVLSKYEIFKIITIKWVYQFQILTSLWLSKSLVRMYINKYK